MLKAGIFPLIVGMRLMPFTLLMVNIVMADACEYIPFERPPIVRQITKREFIVALEFAWWDFWETGYARFLLNRLQQWVRCFTDSKPRCGLFDDYPCPFLDAVEDIKDQCDDLNWDLIYDYHHPAQPPTGQLGKYSSIDYTNCDPTYIRASNWWFWLPYQVRRAVMRLWVVPWLAIKEEELR